MLKFLHLNEGVSRCLICAYTLDLNYYINNPQAPQNHGEFQHPNYLVHEGAIIIWIDPTQSNTVINTCLLYGLCIE